MRYNTRSRIKIGLTYVLLFVLVLSGCGRDAQAKKIAHVQKGEQYFAEEKYAEAIIEFKNAIQLDPNDAQAYYKIALAYLKKGGLLNLKQAYQAFSKTAELDPNLLDAQLKLGELYLLSKHFSEARTKAELVLQRDADNIEAHLLLGNAYAGEQQLDKAIEALHAALQLDPKRTATYLNLAALHLINQDTNAADATYREAIAQVTSFGLGPPRLCRFPDPTKEF